MKKTNPMLPLALILLVFPALYLVKDDITDLASEKLKEQTDARRLDAGSLYVDSAYNYLNHGGMFQYTFVEFGAIGCSACKEMEAVMDDIRATHSEEVHVVFVNVRLPENRILIDYFGVVMIPTQVLLNREGVEFFRHSGYLSKKALLDEMKLVR